MWGERLGTQAVSAGCRRRWVGRRYAWWPRAAAAVLALLSNPGPQPAERHSHKGINLTRGRCWNSVSGCSTPPSPSPPREFVPAVDFTAQEAIAMITSLRHVFWLMILLVSKSWRRCCLKVPHFYFYFHFIIILFFLMANCPFDSFRFIHS